MPAYQLMVIHYHQLDVLGFGLDSTLTSPYLEKATEILAFESGAHKQAQPSHATMNHTQR